MKYFNLFFLCLFSFSLYANEGDKLVTLKVANLKNDNENLIALEMIHEERWHTYWKNPGDSGLPTKFQLYLNEDPIKTELLEWPLPEVHMEAGNIQTYGYEGKQVFYFKSPPLGKLKGHEGIRLHAKWLVCKDICIPGQGSVTGKIEKNQINWNAENLHNKPELLKKPLKNLLKEKSFPEGMSFALSKGNEDKELLLHFELAAKSIRGKELFIPFPNTQVSFKHEKIFYDPSDQKIKGYIPLSWIGHYQTPEVPFPESNNLSQPLNFKFIVKGLSEKPFTASLVQTNIVQYLTTKDYKKLTPYVKEKKSDNKGVPSLLYVLLFAFLGGLILNLMPCVLPVISLKLFELIKTRNESRAKIVRHNSFYALGVILSLLTLAFVILALKATGESIGWGFQLQSPLFVAIMIIVLFVMALNLFGLYEFKTPGGKALGGLTLKDSYIGDFLSGVLATILSTPCSAPFLGTALTYAFTASTFEILLTFLFIGLGLSFPFIVTMIFPGLLKFLPRPGNWMNILKYFLGLTLLLTIVWLLDVLHVLVDRNAILYTFYPILIVIFMGFFVHQKVRRKNWWFMASLIVFSTLSFKFISSASSPSKIIDEVSSDSHWSKWSPATMSNAVTNNETVFVDFTAKWCLTCQVNKKLVLNTPDFYNFSQQNNIKLYRADWTKRDTSITEWLSQNNVVGVPAYFLVKDGKVHPLGETISIKEIKSYF